MNLSNELSRRNFIQTAAIFSAAGTLLPGAIFSQVPDTEKQNLNVAIIGVGRQGKILFHYLLNKIPGIKLTAVCDIWSYSSRRATALSKRAGLEVNFYEDYKQMLEQEKNLDAVIIATPDFVHAEQTIACLEAGLHVYCEKEMSNDIEEARAMVAAMRKSGKLLQIGHQRRSNPYYLHAYHLMHKDKFFGDLVNIRGQWHQQKDIRPMPEKLVAKYSIDESLLQKSGYNSMKEFYNWRWFNKYAGGPMTDLGSHQVDIFDWFLAEHPVSVEAYGDQSNALQMAKANEVGFDPETLDNTTAIYQWEINGRKIQGIYRVDLRTSHGGFYEEFMGLNGSMTISEIKERSAFFKEATAESLDWEDEAEQVETAGGEKGYTFDPLKSRKARGKMSEEDTAAMEANLAKPVHQFHLENFFDAIRDPEVKLTCPGDVAFPTCVSVIKTNQAAVSGEKITFTADDFKA